MNIPASASAYERETEVAIEAAHAAGSIIRTHVGRLCEVDVQQKGIHDLVTQVDLAAQQAIAEKLERAFPDYAMLAEEGAELSSVKRVADGYRWIVDPLDGTTNFTRNVPPFAVSIGLQYKEDIVLGVVLDVATGDLFQAVRGRGAFINGRPMHVSQIEVLDESLITTGFPYRAFGHIDAYLSALKQFMQKTRGVRRPGAAAIDLAYVADGRFEGFFETGLHPWDVAAGLLLVEEAGGRVSDYQNKRNPLFTQQILATNGQVHESMLEILAPMQDMRA